MDKESRRKLERERDKLLKLYTKHEQAAADIAPPIKVLDGMPYSETNAIGSAVESKAMRLMELTEQIIKQRQDIRILLSDLGLYSIRNEEAQEIILYRYMCCMDWNKIKEKLNTNKSPDLIRKTCDYYISTM